MKQVIVRSAVVILFVVAGCISLDTQRTVTTGADRLCTDQTFLLTGKRVGLVTNHTGRLSTGEHLVDALVRQGTHVKALFGPEHGIRGVTEGGEQIVDSVDTKTGIPIYSLYGAISKPTPEMLKDLDVLVYDIQDVGVRFYTYISTMKLCMEAAAEQGIPIVVLDRPNPLGPLVDGPLIEDSLKSFVGIVRVPVVYGLTIGELATMINQRGWLDGGKKADLTVVWVDGWTRSMRAATPWIAPSPNIKHPGTVVVYPATCYLEATNVSEGRGTDLPFELFGAPWIHKEEFAARLNEQKLPGVSFAPATFTPVSSKHSGVECQGVRLTVSDLKSYKPVLIGVTILSVIRELYPDSLVLRARSLGRLLGVAGAHTSIMNHIPPATIENGWSEELRTYRDSLSQFRHYPLQ